MYNKFADLSSQDNDTRKPESTRQCSYCSRKLIRRDHTYSLRTAVVPTTRILIVGMIVTGPLHDLLLCNTITTSGCYIDENDPALKPWILQQ
jgi:hypothetical protein